VQKSGSEYSRWSQSLGFVAKYRAAGMLGCPCFDSIFFLEGVYSNSPQSNSESIKTTESPECSVSKDYSY
jgi:hypothetical protein